MQTLRFFVGVSMLMILTWGSSASAHASPRSIVFLDFRAHDVAVQLHLPVGELQAAWRRPLLPEEGRIVADEGAALRIYVSRYLHAETREGAPWTVAVGDLDYKIDDDVPFVDVHAVMTPPDGASPRTFVLDYDVIAHDVPSHNALVTLRSDAVDGSAKDKPTVLGVIRYLRKSLVIDRPAAWQGFRGLFALGMQHIAEGTDHLLFLFTLLLPVLAGWRRSLRAVLGIVTAFTVGHSITLLFGALGWVRLPSQPVEVLIAVSIFVSAVHAIRPIFAGREAWVAGAFGLVHGLAFASALTELQLDPYHLVLAVLGFNLGLETMQLFVIALTFPWLILLARTRAYPVVRISGAAFAAVASLGWIAERAFHLPNPVNSLVLALAAHPAIVLGTLALVASSATLSARVVPAMKASSA